MNPDYEIGILAAILKGSIPHADLAHFVEGGLDFEYASAKHLWGICKLAWKNQVGNRRLPTVAEIREAITVYSQGHDPLLQQVVLAALERVEAADFTDFTRNSLAEAAMRSRATRVANDIQEALIKGEPVAPLLAEWSQALHQAHSTGQEVEWTDLGDVAALKEMEQERYAFGRKTVPLRIRRFDARTINGGLQLDDVFILLGGTGRGKAQPLSAKIMTPDGWVEMRSMRIGDSVSNPLTGKETTITGVHPQGVESVYRIHFSDNTYTECTSNHLWSARSTKDKHKGKGFKTVPLHSVKIGDQIPQTQAVHFASQSPLPIPPYILGLLLGNAALAAPGVSFSSGSEEILDNFRSLDGIEVIRVQKENMYNHRIVGKKRRDNWLSRAITELGLRGHKAATKFIPISYLMGAPEVRLALLQGLLDTDGYASPDNIVEYSTASPCLRDDVKFIVQSLGGVVKAEGIKVVKGKEYYRMQISLPDNAPPFRLHKKASILRPRKYKPTRIVRAIEYVREEECQCITVADGEHYLTNDFIVTHNSTIGMSICVSMARCGDMVGIIPLEDSSYKMIRRAEDNIRYDENKDIMGDKYRDDFQRSYQKSILDLCPTGCVHPHADRGGVHRSTPGLIAIPRKHSQREWKVRNLYPTVDLMTQKYQRKPDLLFIDHIDKIHPSKEYRREHDQYKEITEDLKTFAEERLIPILTPSQGNRMGHHVERPTLMHVAEGFNKAWAVTQFASICMTPAQRALGELGLLVLKNRGAVNGEIDYIIPMTIDYRKQRVEERPGDNVEIITSYSSSKKPDGMLYGAK